MDIMVGGSVLARCGFVLVCGLALSGCDELGGGKGDAAASATVNTSRGQLRIEERDVEAPDVFSLRSTGLWDGRPTFGGVWVAVPQNVEPDRVKITNLDTGKSIEGGLFRKEVDNPGPSILVSSDAATAIGMQAGTPVDMELVVLRRETVEITPPPPVVPLEDAAPEDDETAVAAADIPAEGISTEALETSVLEAVDASVAAVETAATAAATPAPTPVEAPATATPEPVAPAQAELLPPASEIERPYVQVATVSNPAGANDIIKRLQGAGLSGELRVGQNAGKTIFSVVIGPAQTTKERSEILGKVRKLGFTDAYPV
ncbi:SPOR domain-containing protein [Algicella marina]|uniref:SPOR domain-containing protein n=1 Tax=Algicella marina TaxID=2683284 RepID=A0A6P1T0S6_9RHOB|nr:SPOR domain-containing protein [Algicella marina]QHQ34889.1 SPOR domain-containing protein [Algicella marina]